MYIRQNEKCLFTKRKVHKTFKYENSDLQTRSLFFLIFEHHLNDVLADSIKNAHRAFKVLSLLLGLLHNDRASEENLLRPQALLS